MECEANILALNTLLDTFYALGNFSFTFVQQFIAQYFMVEI